MVGLALPVFHGSTGSTMLYKHPTTIKFLVYVQIPEHALAVVYYMSNKKNHKNFVNVIHIQPA
jgi:hypothetical protein